jgi:hypothetical protein
MFPSTGRIEIPLLFNFPLILLFSGDQICQKDGTMAAPNKFLEYSIGYLLDIPKYFLHKMVITKCLSK